jgi:hypothetical protein
MFQKKHALILILAITISLFLIVAKVVVAAPDTITLQVGASSDDARVRDWWGWGISTVVISGFIGDEGGAGGEGGSIGMRFTNVTIPPGAIINSAVLQLRAHLNDNQVIVRSKIRAEDAGNAQTFSDLTDYQNRPRTTEEVIWDDIGPWTVVGTWHNSPDIKDVIQAVVNRSDWASGSAMVIFFDDRDKRSDNGAHREVSLFDSNPGSAPKLVIDYTPYERCVKPPGWNSTEEDCCIEAIFQDPIPGSGLAACGYRIGSRIGGPDIYDMPALFNPIPCSGATSATAMIIMEIGPAKVCHALGEAACKIETITHDIAGNMTAASSTYNIIAYNLNVSSSPAGIFITGNPAAYGDTTDYQILDIPFGTHIELTAPATHIVGGDTYHFGNWTGCDSPPGNMTCELTMIADKAVVANFDPPGPTAAMDCEIVECGGPGCRCNGSWVTYCGAHYKLWNTSTLPDPGTRYYSSWYYDATLIGFPNCEEYGGAASICHIETIAAVPSGSYTLRLVVEDEHGLSSTATQPVTIKSDIVADFDCSTDDGATWQDCASVTLLTDQTVYFNDISTPSDGGGNIAAWQWEKGSIDEWSGDFIPYGPPFAATAVASTTLTTATDTIRLTVRDQTPADPTGPYTTPGRKASENKTLNVRLPLPEYREVPPTSWIDNFLARLSSISTRF